MTSTRMCDSPSIMTQVIFSFVREGSRRAVRSRDAKSIASSATMPPRQRIAERTAIFVLRGEAIDDHQLIDVDIADAGDQIAAALGVQRLLG